MRLSFAFMTKDLIIFDINLNQSLFNGHCYESGLLLQPLHLNQKVHIFFVKTCTHKKTELKQHSTFPGNAVPN